MLTLSFARSDTQSRMINIWWHEHETGTTIRYSGHYKVQVLTLHCVHRLLGITNGYPSLPFSRYLPTPITSHQQRPFTNSVLLAVHSTTPTTAPTLPHRPSLAPRISSVASPRLSSPRDGYSDNYHYGLVGLHAPASPVVVVTGVSPQR